MSKTVYTPRIGSEIFETSVMKTDEVYIFIKAHGGTWCGLYQNKKLPLNAGVELKSNGKMPYCELL